MRTIRAFVCLSALIWSGEASAQTTYTDRSVFTAASGPVNTVAFNAATGTNVLNGGAASYSSGGVTFSDGQIYNFGPSYSSLPAGAAYGSGYLEWQGANPRLLTVTLPEQVTGIGFDFMDANGRTATYSVTINGTTYVMDSSTAAEFFGYTDATGFSSFTISTPSTQGGLNIFPTIDNFVYAPFAPEPGSWALMIGGFGAVGASMRRRRRSNLRSMLAAGNPSESGLARRGC